MTLDEGYIKYESHWTPGPATHVTAARELERWRRPLYEAQLIGEYAEHGIGYGNISVRRGTGGLFLGRAGFVWAAQARIPILAFPLVLGAVAWYRAALLDAIPNAGADEAGPPSAAT